MRPTLTEILAIPHNAENKPFIQHLWDMRLSRSTRYAKRRQYSQRQRRRDIRRTCPHGWTR